MNLDPFFAVPIGAGLCTYTEARDMLSLDEIADLNEVLLVRTENERRAHDAAERKAKQKR